MNLCDLQDLKSIIVLSCDTKSDLYYGWCTNELRLLCLFVANVDENAVGKRLTFVIDEVRDDIYIPEFGSVQIEDEIEDGVKIVQNFVLLKTRVISSINSTNQIFDPPVGFSDLYGFVDLLDYTYHVEKDCMYQTILVSNILKYLENESEFLFEVIGLVTKVSNEQETERLTIMMTDYENIYLEAHKEEEQRVLFDDTWTSLPSINSPSKMEIEVTVLRVDPVKSIFYGFSEVDQNLILVKYVTRTKPTVGYKMRFLLASEEDGVHIPVEKSLVAVKKNPWMIEGVLHLKSWIGCSSDPTHKTYNKERYAFADWYGFVDVSPISQYIEYDKVYDVLITVNDLEYRSTGNCLFRAVRYRNLVEENEWSPFLIKMRNYEDSQKDTTSITQQVVLPDPPTPLPRTIKMSIAPVNLRLLIIKYDQNDQILYCWSKDLKRVERVQTTGLERIDWKQCYFVNFLTIDVESEIHVPIDGSLNQERPTESDCVLLDQFDNPTELRAYIAFSKSPCHWSHSRQVAYSDWYGYVDMDMVRNSQDKPIELDVFYHARLRILEDWSFDKDQFKVFVCAQRGHQVRKQNTHPQALEKMKMFEEETAERIKATTSEVERREGNRTPESTSSMPTISLADQFKMQVSAKLWEDPKMDEPSIEKLKIDEPNIEESEMEDPRSDEQKVEESEVEESEIKEKKLEESEVVEPKIVEPKIETPTTNELKKNEYFVELIVLDNSSDNLLGYSKEHATLLTIDFEYPVAFPIGEVIQMKVIREGSALKAVKETVNRISNLVGPDGILQLETVVLFHPSIDGRTSSKTIGLSHEYGHVLIHNIPPEQLSHNVVYKTTISVFQTSDPTEPVFECTYLERFDNEQLTNLIIQFAPVFELHIKGLRMKPDRELFRRPVIKMESRTNSHHQKRGTQDRMNNCISKERTVKREVKTHARTQYHTCIVYKIFERQKKGIFGWATTVFGECPLLVLRDNEGQQGLVLGSLFQASVNLTNNEPIIERVVDNQATLKCRQAGDDLFIEDRFDLTKPKEQLFENTLAVYYQDPRYGLVRIPQDLLNVVGRVIIAEVKKVAEFRSSTAKGFWELANVLDDITDHEPCKGWDGDLEEEGVEYTCVNPDDEEDDDDNFGGSDDEEDFKKDYKKMENSQNSNRQGSSSSPDERDWKRSQMEYDSRDPNRQGSSSSYGEARWKNERRDNFQSSNHQGSSSSCSRNGSSAKMPNYFDDEPEIPVRQSKPAYEEPRYSPTASNGSGRGYNPNESYERRNGESRGSTSSATNGCGVPNGEEMRQKGRSHTIPLTTIKGKIYNLELFEDEGFGMVTEEIDKRQYIIFDAGSKTSIYYDRKTAKGATFQLGDYIHYQRMPCKYQDCVEGIAKVHSVLPPLMDNQVIIVGNMAHSLVPIDLGNPIYDFWKRRSLLVYHANGFGNVVAPEDTKYRGEKLTTDQLYDIGRNELRGKAMVCEVKYVYEKVEECILPMNGPGKQFARHWMLDKVRSDIESHDYNDLKTDNRNLQNFEKEVDDDEIARQKRQNRNGSFYERESSSHSSRRDSPPMQSNHFDNGPSNYQPNNRRSPPRQDQWNSRDGGQGSSHNYRDQDPYRDDRHRNGFHPDDRRRNDHYSPPRNGGYETNGYDAPRNFARREENNRPSQDDEIAQLRRELKEKDEKIRQLAEDNRRLRIDRIDFNKLLGDSDKTYYDIKKLLKEEPYQSFMKRTNTERYIGFLNDMEERSERLDDFRNNIPAPRRN